MKLPVKSIHNHLWGHEEWLVNTESYCAKYLIVNYGYLSSLHYHKKKDETFIILEGKVLLELGQTHRHGICRIILRKGDAYRLSPLSVHRFRSLSLQSKILEVSTHHEDSDSVKIKLARKLDKNIDKGYTDNRRSKCSI